MCAEEIVGSHLVDGGVAEHYEDNQAVGVQSATLLPSLVFWR